MTLFWVLAGLMLLAATALIIVPLKRGAAPHSGGQARSNIEIYRHRAAELEAEHARGLIGEEALRQARQELKRALLLDSADTVAAPGPKLRGNRGVIVSTAVMLPLLSVGLYLWLGNAGTVVIAPTPSQPQQSGEASGMHDAEEMVARLEQRLQADPSDAEGWMLLGRSYAYLRRFDAAATAYARALPLKPNDARLLADYAEALAVVQDSRVEGEALRLARQALKLDPANHKALWLTGLERFQNADPAQAAVLWTRLRQQLPPNSPELALVDRYLAQAQSSRAPAAPRAGARAPGASAGAITAHVSLDASLAQKVAAEDIVFIYVRAQDGQRMPLAIARRQVRDLPAEIVLDDAQSMTPGMDISQFQRVTVGARISKSGDALPKAGDLEGVSAPLRVGVESVAQVRIDRVIR